MKRVIFHTGHVLAPLAGSVYTVHRAYSVHLGNKRTLRFASKREANACRAEVARFLNELVQELNTLHAEAYGAFRLAWPALMHHGSPARVSAEQQMQMHLRSSAEALDRAGRRTGQGTNDMHFMWLHLGNCAAATGDAFGEIEQWYRYKTQGVLRHQAAIGRKRCELVLERLRDHGAK